MSPLFARGLMGAALTAGLFWMWRRTIERQTFAPQTPERKPTGLSSRGTVIHSNSPAVDPSGDLGAGI